MAKTGINIQVKDTVLGASYDRNAVSMIIMSGVESSEEAQEPTLVPNADDRIENWPTYGYSFRVTSLSDFDAKTSETSSFYTNMRLRVADFYNPADTLSNDGVPLYISFLTLNAGNLIDFITSDFIGLEELRGVKNVLLAEPYIGYWLDSFGSRVDIVNTLFARITPASNKLRLTVLVEMPFTSDAIEASNGMSIAAQVSCYDRVLGTIRPRAGLALGLVAAIPVGMSIGDCSLPPLNIDPSQVIYLITPAEPPESGDLFEIDDNGLSTIIQNRMEYCNVFVRPRYPKTGLWFNDGSTFHYSEGSSALGTIEAVRTLYAVCYDLQDYFTTYINGRVPVTASGDIQPTFKQVVLDSARSQVINKYIESGDISDARIQLVAKDNDMVGTRTWEVTLSILPAPTLRWIEGYVFYVNKLS